MEFKVGKSKRSITIARVSAERNSSFLSRKWNQTTMYRWFLLKSMNKLSNGIANRNFGHAMRAHLSLRRHACIARFYFTHNILCKCEIKWSLLFVLDNRPKRTKSSYLRMMASFRPFCSILDKVLIIENFEFKSCWLEEREIWIES